MPDIYQGCETVDLSLVDPDNRRPLDHAALEVALDRALADVPDPGADLDLAKLRLTALGLRLRRERPAAFGADGTYLPLDATGAAAEHFVGFVRAGGCAVVATRLALRLGAGGGWRDTVVGLPDGDWHDLLTEQTCTSQAGIAAERLLSQWPVALLVKA